MQPTIKSSLAATGDASRLQSPVDPRHVAPRHGGRGTRRIAQGLAFTWLVVTIVLASGGVIPWVR